MVFENLCGYNYIEKLQLVKHCNEHGRLFCRVSIDADKEKDFLACINKAIILKGPSDIGKEDDSDIFKGTIVEVSVDRGFAGFFGEFIAYSNSYFDDEEIYYRIFQAEEHKYGDILSKDKLGLKNCSLELDGNLKNKKYEVVALQNQETNFGFIKRIAENIGIRLWVQDTLETAKIALKNVLLDMKCSLKNEDIYKHKVSAIHLSGGNKCPVAIVTTSKYICLGQKVGLPDDGTEYVVIGLKMYLCHGGLRFEYELEKAEKSLVERKINVRESAVKLKAKVYSQDDGDHKGRLQVEFIEKGLEDVEKDKPRWFPLHTPYSGKQTGIVFIPDKDDVVDAVFVNGEIFITAAERENSLEEEFQNVKDKFIGNNTKQRIFWKEQSLELHSNDNVIYMDKEKIEAKVGDVLFSLTKDKILFKAKEVEFLSDDFSVGSKNKIALKCSNSGMEIEKSKVIIKGTGEVSIDGGTVKIK